MPRNGSGVYSLPASNPVIDGTIIDVNWANPTMSDIATQLNNVYTRDGLLGPTGPFRVLDGLVSNPGLGFSSETTLGTYRPSTNVIAFAAGGAKQFKSRFLHGLFLSYYFIESILYIMRDNVQAGCIKLARLIYFISKIP